MKELFEDFYISSCTNAFFDIKLAADGELKYQLTDRESESNSIYLEHKETGVTFSLYSKGDTVVLSDYNEIWCSCKRNIDKFKKMYIDDIM